MIFLFYIENGILCVLIRTNLLTPLIHMNSSQKLYKRAIDSMVYAPEQRHNPQALASGLSIVHVETPCSISLVS